MGCTTNSKIVDEVFRRVYPSAALASEAERDGVYAVSLFVYDYEDEPSTPTVELSVNTEAGRSTHRHAIVSHSTRTMLPE
jgi:hypothetical protein